MPKSFSGISRIFAFTIGDALGEIRELDEKPPQILKYVIAMIAHQVEDQFGIFILKRILL